MCVEEGARESKRERECERESCESCELFNFHSLYCTMWLNDMSKIILGAVSSKCMLCMLLRRTAHFCGIKSQKFCNLIANRKVCACLSLGIFSPYEILYLRICSLKAYSTIIKSYSTTLHSKVDLWASTTHIINSINRNKTVKKKRIFRSCIDVDLDISSLRPFPPIYRISLNFNSFHSVNSYKYQPKQEKKGEPKKPRKRILDFAFWMNYICIRHLWVSLECFISSPPFSLPHPW